MTKPTRLDDDTCWGETAKSDEGRLCAWVIEHNSHGTVFDSLVWLPKGQEPETKEEWRRMPWLDQPETNIESLRR